MSGYDLKLPGCLRLVYCLHDFLDGYAPADELHHLIHGRVDMVVEILQPHAEVVQSGFSLRRLGEAVFRAPAAAGKKHVAATAVTGEGGFFRCTEFSLLPRMDHFS